MRPGAKFCAGCGRPLTQEASSANPARKPTSTATALRDQATALKRVGWIFGLLLANSLGMAILIRIFPNLAWPGAAVAAANALTVLAFAVAYRDQLAPLLQWPAASTRTLWQMWIASAVAITVLVAYLAISERLLIRTLTYSDIYREAGLPLWAALLMLTVVPALIEELAFRGLIQTSLERVFNINEAWYLQAALFGVVHLLPLTFFSHAVLGLWLGWLRIKSGSLYPCFVAHALWNAAMISRELWLR
ncbi:MAG TPA: CPBP family intramembrane glutamic endopeptidase [Terriglobales bacterium]|nr:CPBP family intramembrane glutamic endopeptidase [Terriglobales bacterium]